MNSWLISPSTLNRSCRPTKKYILPLLLALLVWKSYSDKSNIASVVPNFRSTDWVITREIVSTQNQIIYILSDWEIDILHWDSISTTDEIASKLKKTVDLHSHDRDHLRNLFDTQSWSRLQQVIKKNRTLPGQRWNGECGVYSLFSTMETTLWIKLDSCYLYDIKESLKFDDRLHQGGYPRFGKFEDFLNTEFEKRGIMKEAKWFINPTKEEIDVALDAWNSFIACVVSEWWYLHYFTIIGKYFKNWKWYYRVINSSKRMFDAKWNPMRYVSLINPEPSFKIDAGVMQDIAEDNLMWMIDNARRANMQTAFMHNLTRIFWSGFKSVWVWIYNKNTENTITDDRYFDTFQYVDDSARMIYDTLYDYRLFILLCWIVIMRFKTFNQIISQRSKNSSTYEKY